ncbi:MAG: hypothetical protein V4757_23150 [Pseudomonadota bacterium]
MSLQELHRIKLWHVSHKADHPLEYQLFDVVLAVWLMGWVGYLPAFMFAVWAIPLCVLGTMAPHAYVSWRTRAHRAGRLRCDWVHTAGLAR